MTFAFIPLSQRSLSLDNQEFIRLLTEQENILIIQDLDGVCMELVKDPLTRVIDHGYLEATKAFNQHFFVLTNGEHIGKRGVNSIVEKAFDQPKLATGSYLPGLAGGGVQWQDNYGNYSHPGVSSAELTFLEAVPARMISSLQAFFQQDNYGLSSEQITASIQATVLDNKVSPTANLNVLYDALLERPGVYLQLQKTIQSLTEQLLQEAQEIGLADSFFVHYAPNLGRDDSGKEIIQIAQESSSGTTDFQFMLRGAIKEVGVLVILNHYYYLHTGNYPLGSDFNARKAPHSQSELIALVAENFDLAVMPTIIGVGDTVTSKAISTEEGMKFQRGGSDRGFLELIQTMGQKFQRDNVVVYVDSSGGELKNRKALKVKSFTVTKNDTIQQQRKVIEGPGDSRDNSDPLTLNLVFPGGYRQYIETFKAAANLRGQKSDYPDNCSLG